MKVLGAAALLLLVFAAVGCGSSPTTEETEAERALAPKPPTEEQKQALEKIKGDFPNANASHAGTP